MQLGVTLPVADIGTGPMVVRDYAPAAEGLGYAHLLVGDHVLGANPGADRGVFVSSAAEMALRQDRHPDGKADLLRVPGEEAEQDEPVTFDTRRRR